MVRLLAVCGVAGLVVAARVQGARPLPPWPYTMPAGGVHGVAWFGSNVSGFENESQMEMLGNYSVCSALPFAGGRGEQCRKGLPRGVACHTRVAERPA